MIADGWQAYTAWAAICLLGTLISLAAEYRRNSAVALAAKLMAATAYIAAAVSLGAWETEYGRVLLAGMACCWLGDLLLVSRLDRRLFLAGLSSFLLGHLFYTAAFTVRGFSLPVLLLAAMALLVFAWSVGRWLKPFLDEQMRVPVWLYLLAISTMMAMAMASYAAKDGIALLLGGLLFVISDLAVARNRFVSPGFVNRAWGLPLYFTAQLLLAASVIS